MSETDLYNMENTSGIILNLILALIHLTHTGPNVLQNGSDKRWDTSDPWAINNVTTAWNDSVRVVAVKYSDNHQSITESANPLSRGVPCLEAPSENLGQSNLPEEELKPFANLINAIFRTYTSLHCIDSSALEMRGFMSGYKEFLYSPALFIIAILMHSAEKSLFTQHGIAEALKKLLESLEIKRTKSPLFVESICNNLDIACVARLLEMVVDINPGGTCHQQDVGITLFTYLVRALTYLYNVESLADALQAPENTVFLQPEICVSDICIITRIYSEKSSDLIKSAYPIRVSDSAIDLNSLRLGEPLLAARLRLDDIKGIVVVASESHKQYVYSRGSKPILEQGVDDASLLFTEACQYTIRHQLELILYKVGSVIGLLDQVILILGTSIGVQGTGDLSNCIGLLEQATVQVRIVEKHLLAVNSAERKEHLDLAIGALDRLCKNGTQAQFSSAVGEFRNILAIELLFARTLQYIGFNIRSIGSLIGHFSSYVQGIFTNISSDVQKQLEEWKEGSDVRIDQFSHYNINAMDWEDVEVPENDCPNCGFRSVFCCYPRKNVTSYGITRLSLISEIEIAYLRSFIADYLQQKSYLDAEEKAFEQIFYQDLSK